MLWTAGPVWSRSLTYPYFCFGYLDGHAKRPSVLSGVHLMGVGRRASILKVAGMPTDHFLPCEGDNWSVENLTFDMGDHTPAPGLGGYQFARATTGEWQIAQSSKAGSGQSSPSAVRNWSIERNYIKRTVPGARPITGAILVTKKRDRGLV